MLGGFELRYNLEPVHLKKRQHSKPVQLLQLLLYNREDGISRHGVIEALYRPETGIDTANNLNVTVSKLRRLLRDTILPSENYICTDIDRYRFKTSFPVQVDTENVLSLRREAAAAAGQERMELLYRLCALYRGQFLPELDGTGWVEEARVYYQRIYQESMGELCRMLWEAKAYPAILHLAECAAKLFPFDEWQAWQYESLLAQGQIRDAQKLYQEVEKLYLSELDAPPPRRMRQRLCISEKEHHWKTQSIQALRDQMDEANRDGPYYLSFPSFLDAYHFICHTSGDAGQPVCLMLCTLQGGDSRSKWGQELFRAAIEQLEAALRQTLRREDSFTRYSRNQYLAVLIGVKEPDCSVIFQRISEQFCRTDSSQHHSLECQLVSSDDAQVSFAGSLEVD